MQPRGCALAAGLITEAVRNRFNVGVYDKTGSAVTFTGSTSNINLESETLLHGRPVRLHLPDQGIMHGHESREVPDTGFTVRMFKRCICMLVKVGAVQVPLDDRPV